MTQVDFYNDLSEANPETMELHGMVLMHKNNSKWHLCKKRASSIGHACGSGAPTDPNSSFYADVQENYNEVRFEKATEVETPKEALEHNRMCHQCQRILQREFDLERLIVAVSEDTPIDVAVERFVNRREESLK